MTESSFSFLIIFILGIILGIVSEIHSRLKRKKLPLIRDDEFYNSLIIYYNIPKEFVISIRPKIADSLNFPVQKLSPAYTLELLRKNSSIFQTDDLEIDLSSAAKKHKIKLPWKTMKVERVADVIYWFCYIENQKNTN